MASYLLFWKFEIEGNSRRMLIKKGKTLILFTINPKCPSYTLRFRPELICDHVGPILIFWDFKGIIFGL